MKKRFLSLFLTLAMMMSVIAGMPISVSAETNEASWFFGEAGLTPDDAAYTESGTLAKAIELANGSDTVTYIKLNTNVSIQSSSESVITLDAGQTMVLDLNGKTLSITSTYNSPGRAIKASGDLTLKNGDIKIENTTTSHNFFGIDVETTGTLTVSECDIEITGPTNLSDVMVVGIHHYTNSASAITFTDSTIAVKGSTIVYGIYINGANLKLSNTALTVSGAENSSYGIYGQTPKNATTTAKVYLSGDVTISGTNTDIYVNSSAKTEIYANDGVAPFEGNEAIVIGGTHITQSAYDKGKTVVRNVTVANKNLFQPPEGMKEYCRFVKKGNDLITAVPASSVDLSKVDISINYASTFGALSEAAQLPALTTTGANANIQVKPKDADSNPLTLTTKVEWQTVEDADVIKITLTGNFILTSDFIASLAEASADAGIRIMDYSIEDDGSCVWYFELADSDDDDSSKQVTNVNVIMDVNDLPQHTVGGTPSQNGVTFAVTTTPETTDAFMAMGITAVKITESNFREVLSASFLEEYDPDGTKSYEQILEAHSAAAEEDEFETDPTWATPMSYINSTYKLKADDTIGIFIVIGGTGDYELAQNATVTLNENSVETVFEIAEFDGVGFYHELGNPTAKEEPAFEACWAINTSPNENDSSANQGTLAAAFDVANDIEDTSTLYIKLLGNVTTKISGETPYLVPTSKSVVLDLNGYTLTVSGATNSDDAIAVKSQGKKFTVQNGTIHAVNTNGKNAIAVSATVGYLNVKNCTVQAEASGNSASAYGIQTNVGTNISNSTITATSAYLAGGIHSENISSAIYIDETAITASGNDTGAYGIYCSREKGIIYLSGTKSVSGTTADIGLYNGTTKLYAHNGSNTYYTGDTIEIGYTITDYVPATNDIVVREVTATIQDKFTLASSLLGENKRLKMVRNQQDYKYYLHLMEIVISGPTFTLNETSDIWAHPDAAPYVSAPRVTAISGLSYGSSIYSYLLYEHYQCNADGSNPVKLNLPNSSNNITLDNPAVGDYYYYFTLTDKNSSTHPDGYYSVNTPVICAHIRERIPAFTEGVTITATAANTYQLSTTLTPAGGWAYIAASDFNNYNSVEELIYEQLSFGHSSFYKGQKVTDPNDRVFENQSTFTALEGDTFQITSGHPAIYLVQLDENGGALAATYIKLPVYVEKPQAEWGFTGTDEYTERGSLAEAFAVANTRTNVTYVRLIENVTLTEALELGATGGAMRNMDLDLNGKTVTYTPTFTSGSDSLYAFSVDTANTSHLSYFNVKNGNIVVNAADSATSDDTIGGIFTESNRVYLTDCNITVNGKSAKTYGFHVKPGVSNTMTITISGGSITANGSGAVEAIKTTIGGTTYLSKLSITDCAIKATSTAIDTVAYGIYSVGAPITVNGGSITVTGTFGVNGIYVARNCPLSVTNCTIKAESTNNEAIAISTNYAATEVVGSTITAEAATARALKTYGNQLKLINTTVTASTSVESGIAYGVDINASNDKLLLGGTTAISGETVDVWMNQKGSISATDGTTPYSGDTIDIFINNMTFFYKNGTDQTPVVNDVTNDNEASFTLTNEDYYLARKNNTLVVKEGMPPAKEISDKLGLQKDESIYTLKPGTYTLGENNSWVYKVGNAEELSDIYSAIEAAGIGMYDASEWDSLTDGTFIRENAAQNDVVILCEINADGGVVAYAWLALKDATLPPEAVWFFGAAGLTPDDDDYTESGSLTDAFTAANRNNTANTVTYVKMLKDVTVTDRTTGFTLDSAKTMVLDMADKSISVTSNSSTYNGIHGIYISGTANLTVKNGTISVTATQAVVYGIYAFKSASTPPILNVSNCDITTSTPYTSVGINNMGGTLTVSDGCNIHATNGTSPYGGNAFAYGIFVDNKAASATVSDSTISAYSTGTEGNEAQGIIARTGAFVKVTNCTVNVEGNKQGNGVFVYSILTLTDSTVNVKGRDTYGVYGYSGSAITGSSINVECTRTSSIGVQIYEKNRNSPTSFTVSDTTVIINSAGYGTGIDVADAFGTISNSKFSVISTKDTYSDVYGISVSRSNNANAKLVVSDCIITAAHTNESETHTSYGIELKESQIYLSGDITVSGKNADIWLDDTNSKIYANDGAETPAYCTGENIIKVGLSYIDLDDLKDADTYAANLGKVVVYGVNEDNNELFETADDLAEYYCLADSDPFGNLVLAEPESTEPTVPTYKITLDESKLENARAEVWFYPPEGGSPYDGILDASKTEGSLTANTDTAKVFIYPAEGYTFGETVPTVKVNDTTVPCAGNEDGNFLYYVIEGFTADTVISIEGAAEKEDKPADLGTIVDLGKDIITVNGNRITVNKPENDDDEYFYYMNLLPIETLETIGYTPEQYVAHIMAGVDKNIIDVTGYDLSNQADVDELKGLSTAGQVEVAIGGPTGETLIRDIEKDSVVIVYKKLADNANEIAYPQDGNLFAPQLPVKYVVVYGLYGVYATIVTAEDVPTYKVTLDESKLENASAEVYFYPAGSGSPYDGILDASKTEGSLTANTDTAKVFIYPAEGHTFGETVPTVKVNDTTVPCAGNEDGNFLYYVIEGFTADTTITIEGAAEKIVSDVPTYKISLGEIKLENASAEVWFYPPEGDTTYEVILDSSNTEISLVNNDDFARVFIYPAEGYTFGETLPTVKVNDATIPCAGNEDGNFWYYVIEGFTADTVISIEGAAEKIVSDTDDDTSHKVENNMSGEVKVDGLGTVTDTLLEEVKEQNSTATSVKVEVTLEIEAKEPTDIDQTEKTHIEDVAADNQSEKLDYVEIDITQKITIDNGTPSTSPVTDTKQPIKIEIAFPTEGKTEFKVYRYHDGVVKVLTTTEVDGEKIEIEDGKIVIYAKFFSTYAIGYNLVSSMHKITLAEANLKNATAEVLFYPAGSDTPYQDILGGSTTEGSLTSNTDTAKVFITPAAGYTFNTLPTVKVNDVVIPCAGNDGNIWYFVIDSFAADSVIAIEGEAEEIVTNDPTTPNVPFVPVVYSINVANVPGGTILANQVSAIYARVNVQVIPDNGYELAELIVTTTYGKTVKVTAMTSDIYSFVMPNAPVTVSAVFRKIETGCPKDSSCPIWSYTDTTTLNWYHDGIHYCLENDLMVGFPNNIFAPNEATTRAQLLMILWRLEGQPTVDIAEAFNDVLSTDWYYKAIRWASNKGIVEGYGNGCFGPNDTLTREQMVTILWRYAKSKGYDVSIGEKTNILSFSDSLEIAEYAIPAMQWACGSGIVQGTKNNDDVVLSPKGNTTRAQMATMIMRFREEIVK